MLGILLHEAAAEDGERDNQSENSNKTTGDAYVLAFHIFSLQLFGFFEYQCGSRTIRELRLDITVI